MKLGRKRVMLVDYANYWLDTYKMGIRYNTRTNYKNVIKKLEKVDCPLYKFNRQIYIELLKECTDYSKTRMRLCLTQIIKCAISEKILKAGVFDDIFGQVKVKTPPSKQKRALTQAEVHEVYNINLKPMDKAYLWIIFGCGLRREEVLALTPNDLKDGCISVNKTIIFSENGSPILENKTKSHNSMRVVPMPQFLIDYMTEYLQISDVVEYNKLFYSTRKDNLGDYFKSGMWQCMTKRIFSKMSEDLGYNTGLTSHSFRHNYCSNLCYQIPAISIKTVAELLGDTVDVVLNTYNHVISEREDKQSAIENALKF